MNNLSFLSSTAQALNRSLDQAGKEQPKYVFKQPLSKQNPKPPISTSIERELDKHSEQKRSKKKTQEPRKKIDLAQVIPDNEEDYEKESQRSSYEFQRLQQQRKDPASSSKHKELMNNVKKFRNISKPSGDLKKQQPNSNPDSVSDAPTIFSEKEQLLQDLKVSLNVLNSKCNQVIFRPNSLRKFIQTTLAQINPQLSLSSVAVDYYSNAFQEFLVPRLSYTFFDIMQDQANFQYWPEAMKMDYFMEQAWKKNYEDEAVQKFLYNLQ